MSELEIIKQLSDFSALGVIALALIIIYQMIKNRNGNGSKKIYAQVMEKIKTNDFHEIKTEIHQDLQRIEDKFDSRFNAVWSQMNKNSNDIAEIKGKINK